MKQFVIGLLLLGDFALADTPGQFINKTCPVHQWFEAITPTSGAVCTQPAYSDLSGAPTPGPTPTPVPQGNLTEDTSSVLTIGSGTGAVIGSGTTIQVKAASTSQAGYLSSTDWNTFNGKQAAGNYLAALTSDVSASGPGSVAATVNSVGGSSAANIHSAELAANAATSLSVVNTLVKRDVNGNAHANNFESDVQTTTSAGATTFLTAGSPLIQQLTGSTSQTYQLPDATTLHTGHSFEFSNNNTTGLLTVKDAAGGTVTTVPFGGYAWVLCTGIGSAAGTWDKHFLISANGAYGTAGMTVTGTVTATGGFIGNADSATNATNVATTATNSTNSDYSPTFVGSASGGNQAIRTASGLTFHPSTNTLTTTTFAGALTGAASSNVLKVGDTMTGTLNNFVSTDVVPIISKGASAGTSDLFQAQNNAGTVLAKVDSRGNMLGINEVGPTKDTSQLYNNFGTVTGPQMIWTEKNHYLCATFNGTTGTLSAGTFSVTLPSSKTVDTSFYTSAQYVLGRFFRYTSGGTTNNASPNGPWPIFYDTANSIITIALNYGSGTNIFVNNQAPSSFIGASGAFWGDFCIVVSN